MLHPEGWSENLWFSLVTRLSMSCGSPREWGRGLRGFAGRVGQPGLPAQLLTLSSRHFLLDHKASAGAHKCLAIGKDTLL